ncbi:MAG: hypothetical protein A2W61_01250 [Deltaproteobacteria bacterium RIFCSPLOWO2_01_44_7]|nr:MAG: hypothetical protein A2712_00690 [Deltaproteobacteria bacterium RIFCSPHIGHO2_01_FULL_43_49]OGQ14208.1 MAG: hypothetical protein A3D22_09925 [Deltaproteobacteria bacterium RIFCSPHIGHO2_02_FULL_44_53]OGQ27424.1 MAG: hypothetical protein A3D98_03525 [Deltaproteobacteria bacterium RIFCSPHIGHO2_12_FULL_44_21]OGQ30672.1 MAG: hypothetical protein A2979_05950 [Deltaproteobacteria bacterium RIFCSPLOWO2_01_FULL_45_74]OGQ37739.1 MAG: hypothetical protein A2W61_01250 [Deltaproteobacteria bacterium 
MKIYYSPYELIPLSSLNRRVQKAPRSGALLRIIFEEGLEGFANLHPNPERGDFSFEKQLELLAQGGPTPQTKISIKLAKIDAKARAQRKSLWNDLTLPLCHYLVTEPIGFSQTTLLEALEKGFRKFKIKTGRDLKAEIDILNQWAEVLPPKSLRPDFNRSLDQKGLQLFCKEVSPTLVKGIDFVEDPTPDSPEIWHNASQEIPWAWDQGSEKIDPLSKSFQVVVLKPAIQDLNSIWPVLKKVPTRIVFTSYMDHPVGQLGACFVAARFYKTNPHCEEVCGLMSQSIFEKTPYQECITTKGPQLIPPDGVGVGFADLLEKEPWKRLSIGNPVIPIYS